MALQMNVSGIRRNLKNIAHNYTDAQIKVREATSNDPWGPSSTLMSEVADLTYNVVAFTEIMQMIWKRLNDHGRNWRHVYKALVLLEYLIKTGSEKVADQCKENIFAIETLKDFQYFEENKDQGMNVREKAKALVTLLKDEERLRNERVRALKAKERFAQSVSGIGSDSKSERNQAEELTIVCDGDKDISSPTSPTYHDTFVTSTSRPSERNAFGIKDGPSGLEPQLEAARPQTVGEEELQLQLALAMSKEEAEQEEQKKRSDDVRLQMAITQSEEDFNGVNGGGARPASTPPSTVTLDPWGMPTSNATASATSASPQHTAHIKQNLNLAQATRSLDDLFSNGNIMDGLTDPWGMALPNGGSETPNQPDPWGSPVSGPPSRMTSPPTTDPWAPARSPEPPMGGICGNDPWAVLGSVPPAKDPWEPVENKPPPSRDPFSPLTPTDNRDMDEFTALSTREKPTNNGSSDAFDLSGLSASVTDITSISTTKAPPQKSKSPAAFLGENSNLVNLDNLVSAKQAPTGLGVNPFSSPSPPNPFQAQQAPKPSMNQLRTTAIGSVGLSGVPPPSGSTPGPWGPTPAQPSEENPFLL
ncbi:epsin-2-like isoform X17 [Scylla paramamosain]|uniref:epsin-2-like isoform X17 n=1 Tax=Scylla paramamosain TaxID=85552 RepID=UPI0030834D0B